MLLLDRCLQLRQYLAQVARYTRSPVNTVYAVDVILRLPQIVRYNPELVKIETTTRCNLACRFCGHTWGTLQDRAPSGLAEGSSAHQDLINQCRQTGSNMSVKMLEQILVQFPHASRLDLQGLGEPLVNPDFLPILEVCAQRRMRVQFFTNGTLLTREVSRRLVELRVAEISISLDGASGPIYEMMRIGARFDAVVANVQALIEERRHSTSQEPYVRLVMVATTHNVSHMADLVALGRSLDVDEIVVSGFKAISPALASWVCDAEDLRNATAEADTKARELNMRFVLEYERPRSASRDQTGSSSSRCLWPWLSVNVTIDGFLTPCSYIPCHDEWRLGNLLDVPFRELWNDKRYQNLRHRLRSGQLQGLACEGCCDAV